ncbi:MAG: transposase [Gaiellaceae bacterium]
MSVMPKIPPYSLEFRLEAVRLLRSSDRSVPQLARELGVSPQTLRNWSVQLEVDEGRAEGLSSAEREELRRLRRENRILAEEREILKKIATWMDRCSTWHGVPTELIAHLERNWPSEAGCPTLSLAEFGC